MPICDACGSPAHAETTVACCDSHKPLVTGLLAALRPGDLAPGVHLSAARRQALTQLQEMVRELSEATYLFSSPDIEDERFLPAFARVEELWAALHGGGRERLQDLLH